jgi:hypothetical protein
MITLSSYSNPVRALFHFASKMCCPQVVIVSFGQKYFDTVVAFLFIQRNLCSQLPCDQSLYIPSGLSLFPHIPYYPPLCLPPIGAVYYIPPNPDKPEPYRSQKVDLKFFLCEHPYVRGLQRSRKIFCAFCAKLNW